MTGIPNPVLREHVTSAAFALILGKTHVTALVRLDLELAAELTLDYGQVRGISRAHQLDVQARNQLASRGLIVSVWEENKRKWQYQEAGTGRWVTDFDKDPPPGEHWHITRAGRLVIELLQEAGLYQEQAGPILPLIEARKATMRKRKRRAS
jgi:hypothetical protein